MIEEDGYELFAANDIREIFQRRKTDLLRTIDLLPDEVVVGRDALATLQSLVQKCQLTAPALDLNDIHITAQGRRQIDVRNDVYRPFADRTQPCMVDGQFITVAFPFSGDWNLLLFKPVTYGFIAPNACVKNNSVEYVFEGAPAIDIESMNREKDAFTKRLEKAVGSIASSIQAFNLEVEKAAADRLEAKQIDARSRQQAVNSLGIPARYRSKESESTSLKDPSEKDMGTFEYDVFISHAFEDKLEVVRPLKSLLEAADCKVWVDEAILEIGDSLPQKIDEGLRISRYGIVVLSPDFFKKNWPRYELDGLVTREMSGQGKVILPVWHNVDRDKVAQYSTPLSVRFAGNTENGVEQLAQQLLRVIKKV
jgi:hypothetical protein